MNTPDSTGSMYVQLPIDGVPNPAYPAPPGGGIPDLNLATWPGVNDGASIQVMPDPEKPAPMDYSLVGDPTCGGYDASNPAPMPPNLAGVDGWPNPKSLVTGEQMFPGSIGTVNIAPQYGVPDFSQPTLKTANLANDGISFDPRGEWDPDPMHPDLTSYNHPIGLTIHNSTLADLFKPDPVLADLTNPDIPHGIQTLKHPLEPDPNVPDLQNPQLEQSVHMVGRPGDMDPSALSVMSGDPLAQATSTVPYATSFMDATGLNTTRRRRMDLMMNGLRAEEK